MNMEYNYRVLKFSLFSSTIFAQIYNKYYRQLGDPKRFVSSVAKKEGISNN